MMYQDEYVSLVGSASARSADEEDEHRPPLATLWLPDPESHSGWGMRQVWHKPEKKSARSVGFRRRGER